MIYGSTLNKYYDFAIYFKLVFHCRFVRELKDIMWYLDDHHDSLKRAWCKLPVHAERFQNYNRPQDHGHSKTKLNAERLQEFSDQLGEYINQVSVNINHF